MQVREPNLKYLALENMARLAEVPAVVDTGGCWTALGWAGLWSGVAAPAAMGREPSSPGRQIALNGG